MVTTLQHGKNSIGSNENSRVVLEAFATDSGEVYNLADPAGFGKRQSLKNNARKGLNRVAPRSFVPCPSQAIEVGRNLTLA